jgi:2-dehydro-3-deoxy-D-arabinonate dehydratase
VGIWKVRADGGVRLAIGAPDAGPERLLPPGSSLDELLAGPRSLFESTAAAPGLEPVPGGTSLLAPLGTQEIWAAGVTYERSRVARMEESDTPDFYDLVYDSRRPELFFKAAPGRARGPNERIGVRADSRWDVPEPELAVVANRSAEIVAYAIGNDVSSRSIEGENPLYLPQAKVYSGSCALGPCLVPLSEAPDPGDMTIELSIERGGAEIFSESLEVSNLHRSPEELVGWLYRALDFPVGAVLLTGTAIVPGTEFTLATGDRVTISVTGLGRLTNTVEKVGAQPPR